MQNVDKYREAILCGGVDIDRLDCHIAALRGVGAGACKNDLCKMCMRESFRWLFSEYEPPLLENGDGLKPGDWIMVRNDENDCWTKRIFAYYYNDHFYAACLPQDLVDHAVYKWKQARLPEDSE